MRSPPVPGHAAWRFSRRRYRERAVDMLERVGVDAYKIASGDLTWTQLIERCARTGKPVIISTGLATLDEIARAYDAARVAGAASVALLHCVSAYPVPQGSENLRAIATLAEKFPGPVGLSDHATDTFAVPMAVALGASIYERHFILSDGDDAVDAAVSSNAAGFADIVRTAARATAALGSGVKTCLAAEAPCLVSRRGLYAARDLAAGHTVSADDIIALRPASALSADKASALIGSTLARDMAEGAPFLLTRSRGSVVTSLNVLITAASRRVPLVRAFRRALDQIGGGSVIVTDVNPLSPAVYTADRAFRVSMASDPGYVDEILAISAAADVGLVVPTIDDELTALAVAAPTFAAADIRVAVSSADTIAICNDKHATCRTLRAKGIAAATSFLPGELPPDPAVSALHQATLRPRQRGGVPGPQRRASWSSSSTTCRSRSSRPILDGPEFTIDMLCDFSGRPLSIVPRERVVIRAGVTDRGRTSRIQRLIDACRLVRRRRSTFAGPVNIQCRMVHGRPIVFEINPRFSGGIPLTIAAGADFPRMLVELTRGGDVAPAIGRFRENVWITNYETGIFLDAAGDQARAVRTAPVIDPGGRVSGGRHRAPGAHGLARLPGKALATRRRAGPCSQHCVERLRARSGLPVVLATTTRAEDDCARRRGHAAWRRRSCADPTRTCSGASSWSPQRCR